MTAKPEGNYGPCCACEQSGPTVRHVMQLDFLAPEGFSGWDCFVCHLPMRGAIAILCDSCLAAATEPRFIATGRDLLDGKRQSLDSFPRAPFAHTRERHPEMCRGLDDPGSMWQGEGPSPAHALDFAPAPQE